MKNKKLLFLAGTLILGASSLVSCGEAPATSQQAGTTSQEQGTSQTSQGGGSDVGIKIWAPAEDIVAEGFMEKAVAAFKEKNPSYANATFDLKPMPEGDAAKSLKDDPDAAADVLHYAGDQLSTLVKGDFLYKMPKTITSGLGINADVLKAGQISGNQYGIPFTPNTYFMYYDASVYSEEEITSFNAMVSKAQTAYKYNFGLDIFNGWYLQSLFFSAGCNICGEDGTNPQGGITPEATGKKVVSWAWDYVNGANKAKLLAADPGAHVGVDTAAGVTGTWNASTIKEAIEAAGGTYAAAPLPKADFNGDGVEEAWQSVGDYKHIGINKVTKQPELAARFAAHLASTEMQVLRFKERSTAPTDEEALKDESLSTNIALAAQTKQLVNTFAQPTVLGDCKPSSYWDAATAFGGDLKGATKAQIADVFEAFVASFSA